MRGRMKNEMRHNVKPVLGATHRRADGGKVTYGGAGSNVAKEAMERAKGGKVAYSGGESNVAKEAAMKKRGGMVKKQLKVGGHAGKHNLAHRARGGRAFGGSALASSSTHHPLSSAGATSNRSNKEGG